MNVLNVRPLGSLCDIAARIGWHGLAVEDRVEAGELLVTGTNFVDGQVQWSRCVQVSEADWRRDPRIQLAEGDVLLTKDGTIGKVALVRDLPRRATLNSGVFRLRPARNLHPRYLFWVLQSGVFDEFVGRIGSGSTINHLYQRDVSKLPVPLPTGDNQRVIADFLDEHVGRLNKIIGLRQQQADDVGYLFAVAADTALAKRGWHEPATLEAGAMYPVPDGWRVARLSQVLHQLTNGYVGPTRDILVDQGIRYVQGMHIKGGEIDFDRRHFFVTPEWHAQRPRIHLREGDVLIVQTGDIGRVAVVPSDFGEASCHALQIARVRPEIISGAYLGAYLGSSFGYHSLLSRATGALHPHLEGGIRSVPVLIPPHAIQAQVAREVDEQRLVLREATVEMRSQIASLKERRRSLITAAITGEFDVSTASGEGAF